MNSFNPKELSREPTSRLEEHDPQLRGRSFVRMVIYGTLSVLFLSVVVGGVSFYSYLDSLGVFDDHSEPISRIKNYIPNSNTYVYDRNNIKIGEFFDNYQVAVPFEDIPKNLVNAIISIEDRNFWSHGGYDIKSIMRATFVAIENRFAGQKKFTQGGSTLTQQVVRKFVLTDEKTIDRKIMEIVLARNVEKAMDKKAIFSAYVNRMFLGNGAYGVGAAAQRYFGKSVRDLTLGESALIAGLFQLPSKYNPVKYPEVARKRQARVLQAMYEAGFISKDKALAAVRAPLEYREYKPINAELAPHFVDYINSEAKRLLARKYDSVASQGLRIYTTLDMNLQTLAQKTFAGASGEFQEIKRHIQLRKNADGTTSQPEVEAALLTINPKTGEVLAMVGGRDYRRSQFNRTVQSERSPGSAFKTLVFSKALESGWKWSDVLYVSPIAIDDYRPRNVTGASLEEYTMASAFYRSVNTAAVEVAKKLGIENIIRHARKFGIKSPIKNELGSALGSSTMTMLELGRAYGGFANKGRVMPTIAITRILNAQGEVVYDTGEIETLGTQAVDEQNAFLVTKGLENVLRHGTGYEYRDLANLNMVGKTGTSNENKDNWFCGYSSELVSVVWVGTDSFDPIKGHMVGGSRAALPIWAKYMRQANQLYPSRNFLMPEKIVEHKVDPTYGYLSDNGIKMYFQSGIEPTQKQKNSSLKVISQTGRFRSILD